MTDYKFRAAVAVVASKRDQANNWWANNIDTGGQGDQTFNIRLSQDGQEPVTWYACLTSLTKDQLQEVRDIIDAQADNEVRLVIWPTPYGSYNYLLDRFVHNPPKVRVLDTEYSLQDLLNHTGMQVVP